MNVSLLQGSESSVMVCLFSLDYFFSLSPNGPNVSILSAKDPPFIYTCSVVLCYFLFSFIVNALK